tara:strand:- start:4506 stop:5633 length:1128 start_codon:yes stop_codon:yes gene_type:complete
MGVGSFDTFFKSLDDDSEKRGKQWEVACKWFLENDGAYSELEKVWLWDDWPGKDSRDIGIDLVAKTKQGKLWAIQAKAWEEGFASLLKYVEEHKTVPAQSYKESDGYTLGTWVGNQRHKRNKGNLSPEQKARLESIEGWVWEHRVSEIEAAWEEGFARLLKYVEKHKAIPAQGYKEPDSHNLGSWVRTQRGAYTKGNLLSERKARLESVEGWVWNTFEAAWEEGFASLLKYVTEHGDALVPGNYKDPDGYKLGGWISRQRLHVDNSARMSPERKARLESVEGWAWELSNSGQPKAIEEAQWKEGFEKLLKYVEEHGDALVPTKYKDLDGYRLGSWISRQRETYGRGKLAPERKARLESVEGWVWDASFRESSKNR